MPTACSARARAATVAEIAGRRAVRRGRMPSASRSGGTASAGVVGQGGGRTRIRGLFAPPGLQQVAGPRTSCSSYSTPSGRTTSARTATTGRLRPLSTGSPMAPRRSSSRMPSRPHRGPCRSTPRCSLASTRAATAPTRRTRISTEPRRLPRRSHGPATTPRVTPQTRGSPHTPASPPASTTRTTSSR